MPHGHAVGDYSMLFCLCEECKPLPDNSAPLATHAGLTQPHPNAACILVGPDGRPLTSAFQWAQVCVGGQV